MIRFINLSKKKTTGMPILAILLLLDIVLSVLIAFALITAVRMHYESINSDQLRVNIYAQSQADKISAKSRNMSKVRGEKMQVVKMVSSLFSIENSQRIFLLNFINISKALPDTVYITSYKYSDSIPLTNNSQSSIDLLGVSQSLADASTFIKRLESIFSSSTVKFNSLTRHGNGRYFSIKITQNNQEVYQSLYDEDEKVNNNER